MQLLAQLLSPPPWSSPCRSSQIIAPHHQDVISERRSRLSWCHHAHPPSHPRCPRCCGRCPAGTHRESILVGAGRTGRRSCWCHRAHPPRPCSTARCHRHCPRRRGHCPAGTHRENMFVGVIKMGAGPAGATVPTHQVHARPVAAVVITLQTTRTRLDQPWTPNAHPVPGCRTCGCAGGKWVAALMGRRCSNTNPMSETRIQ